jgi:pimeloyl-ACP methyl ester carboxylesterase
MKPILQLLLLALLLTSCREQNTSTTEKNKNEQDMKDSMNFKSGYAEVNGLKMYYEIYGEGKPLVLLHGGGSTIQTSFGRIIPQLSKNRQVIGIELQAHGRTGDRDTGISFEQDADDVAGLLKSMGIEKADILGFSNGGNTTIQIALRHPQLVNKIIVASAFYKREGAYPQFWEFMKHAEISQMPQQYKDTYLKVAPDPGRLHSMHDKCVERMVNFKDLSDDHLRSIRVPTLLVIGDADVMKPEHAVEMYRLIPNCQLAIIPGGHGKYIGEITTISSDSRDAEYVVPMIEEFLNRHVATKQ